MIQLNNLTFSYRKKDRPALCGVTATIMPGVHLLVGENGAGKTTLLHLMAGVASPSSGECLIDGVPGASDAPACRRRSFLLGDDVYFPGNSVCGFARLHSRFYPSFSEESFLSNLDAFGLTGNEKLKNLSLGNRKKAQLAYALALGVGYLYLDEPTNGLDIQSKQALVRLLAANLRDDQTVVVSTHTVSELENLYDGAVVLSRSELLFAGSSDFVASRIAFGTGRLPEPDALYSEIQMGRVLSISPYDGAEPSRVDWRLLYSSLFSPQREEILNLLKS